ncbi:MAG: DUF2933 domain-containing protein [Actinomycetota bacterium]|nr:DUF2933 domain-containing protein [Actinomycetota bacterium]MDQ6945544.1 DUF2933 domain-containing protein [Actinomycetota bacterium]
MNHNRMHISLLGAAAIAAVLVIAWVPLAGLLPFALLLGCGLMMFFMMKGMGGMGRKEDHSGHGCELDPASKVEETPEHESADHRF